MINLNDSIRLADSLTVVVDDLNRIFAANRQAGSPALPAIGAAKLRYAERLQDLADDAGFLTVEAAFSSGESGFRAARIMDALRDAGLDPCWH